MTIFIAGGFCELLGVRRGGFGGVGVRCRLRRYAYQVEPWNAELEGNHYEAGTLDQKQRVTEQGNHSQMAEESAFQNDVTKGNVPPSDGNQSQVILGVGRGLQKMSIR